MFRHLDRPIRQTWIRPGGVFALLLLVGGLAFWASQPTVVFGDRYPERNDKPPARTLWREGSRVELLGTFQGGGVETITFRPQSGDQTYRVLENLALERVAKVLVVNRRRLWQVTAEVTEYENSNYLLLRRVVVKGKLNPDGSQS